MSDAPNNATPSGKPSASPEAAATEAALAAKREYDARQAALATGGAPPEEGAGDDGAGDDGANPEGELIGGKFKTQEELLKAYQELERKQSEDRKSGGRNPKDGPPTEHEVAEVLTEAGLDFDALSAEYAETGGLSDATFEAITKAGIPRSMAEAYIAGQEALAAQRVQQLYTVAGGEEAYQAAQTWAAKNLDGKSIDAFNKLMDSNDPVVQEMAVQSLMQRYREANPGGKPVSPSGEPKAKGPSPQSLVKATTLAEAMNDPRYFPGRQHSAQYVLAVQEMVRQGLLK